MWLASSLCISPAHVLLNASDASLRSGSAEGEGGEVQGGREKCELEPSDASGVLGLGLHGLAGGAAKRASCKLIIVACTLDLV